MSRVYLFQALCVALAVVNSRDGKWAGLSGLLVKYEWAKCRSTIGLNLGAKCGSDHTNNCGLTRFPPCLLLYLLSLNCMSATTENV